MPGVEVLPLQMAVQQTVGVGGAATLEVDGRTVGVRAMRPNVVVPPVTPAGGITGPLLYAGRGRLEDYGGRTPGGAVVVLGYDSGDAWELAFALGARAVVFVGEGEETPSEARDAAVPRNLPRFYIDAADAAAAGLDLTVDRDTVTLRHAETWRTGVGRNLVGFIPGTDPTFGEAASGGGPRQVMVVATGFDTYGNVPRESPGARGAANVAALLGLAERFAATPPRRDTVLLFLDAETRRHQGGADVLRRGDDAPGRSSTVGGGARRRGPRRWRVRWRSLMKPWRNPAR